ncbi:MAG: hypothetical protein IJI22_00505 [Bacilli bacterium]|nr:hypothetical protein [Bacilli bacterium]
MAQRKEKNKFNLFFVIGFIVICFLISWFILLKNKHNSPTFLYNVSYEPSSNVEIESILPVSDKLGKEFDGTGTKSGVQGYVEITIENQDTKKHDYSILVIKSETNPAIDGNYIKFYLTDSEDIPMKEFDRDILPYYDKLEVYKKNQDYKCLTTISLNAGEKKVLKLKSWLSDSYVVSLNKDKFKFVVSVVEEY